jgi:hypothetical protein
MRNEMHYARQSLRSPLSTDERARDVQRQRQQDIVEQTKSTEEATIAGARKRTIQKGTDESPQFDARGAPAAERTIFTIGHSTRAIADFVALLRQVDVDLLVDVRSIPRSRAAPQFNLDVLPVSLAAEGIGYQHLGALGGRRHHPKGAPPSANTFWRVLAFRNYADYAETDAFRAGFAELLALATTHRCAIMCAEAVWWRCHRRIIADYILAQGIPVEHIMALGTVTPATLTPGAVVRDDGAVRYPAPATDDRDVTGVLYAAPDHVE